CAPASVETRAAAQADGGNSAQRDVARSRPDGPPAEAAASRGGASTRRRRAAAEARCGAGRGGRRDGNLSSVRRRGQRRAGEAPVPRLLQYVLKRGRTCLNGKAGHRERNLEDGARFALTEWPGRYPTHFVFLNSSILPSSFSICSSLAVNF